MAELYLARASGIEGFEKLVALKRILPQHASNPDFVAMFFDEARLAASLQHANIAQVYDIGQTEDALFFTMEFVHGKDVRTVLQTACERGRKVPMELALRIATGVAAGLHAAHEKTDLAGAPLGIVHRDVSPSNVLVSYDGCVKVIDFGVAKATQRATETVAGTLKGKVAYMSPEQCLGKPLDRRSDVFSFGIVLYELTTRTRLFASDNDFKTMTRIVEGRVPSPAKRVPGYPEELAEVVMKALAVDPEQRYATTQEVQLDLERFARRHGLVMSNVRLASYMRRTFADDLRTWESTRRGFSTGEVSALRDDAAPSEVISDAVSAPLSDHELGTPAPSVVAEARGRPRKIAIGAAGAVIGFVAMLALLLGVFGGDDSAPAVDSSPAPASTPVVEQSVDPQSLVGASPTVTLPPEERTEPEPRARTRPRAKAAKTKTVKTKKTRPSQRQAPGARPSKKKPRRRPARRTRSWNRDSALPPM
jgi:serine/threonine protein kinase